MTAPDWWATLLIVFAAFRTWRLAAKDTILERPRRWAVRLPREWQDDRVDPETRRPVAADPIPDGYRAEWAKWLTCPWCAGFWIVGALLGVYCVVFGWVGWYAFIVTWLAASGAVGLIAKLDPDDE